MRVLPLIKLSLRALKDDRPEEIAPAEVLKLNKDKPAKPRQSATSADPSLTAKLGAGPGLSSVKVLIKSQKLKKDEGGMSELQMNPHSAMLGYPSMSQGPTLASILSGIAGKAKDSSLQEVMQSGDPRLSLIINKLLEAKGQ